MIIPSVRPPIIMAEAGAGERSTGQLIRDPDRPITRNPAATFLRRADWAKGRRLIPMPDRRETPIQP
ncbi:hypothetical protein [Sphingomonas quercus]|uniref:Uncharacterized protein n=1 Tax=Sphingomonas quercus TaxID=2842451 RepID=A0ABS6BIQ8_9SPHN|nr:hypothetical protein [Sphingomonas quercus]MBU3078064.1 hypothetical protein [Sphingomonas quercus]